MFLAPPPAFLFNTTPQRGCRRGPESESSISLGPNGVPYKFSKNCPGVLRFLWNLLRVVWKKNVIPSEWQRAVTVLIPKEQNSSTLGQFRSIALLNVEGKIFFSIMARRMTNYLTSNGYIDTSCQKAGVPGFPGYVEHSAVIWEQIQRARRERSYLHVMWLVLANAYGSVPNQLINFALDFFLHPRLHQRPGGLILCRPLDVLRPSGLHHRLAAALSGYCDGMFDLSHPIRRSL